MQGNISSVIFLTICCITILIEYSYKLYKHGFSFCNWILATLSLAILSLFIGIEINSIIEFLKTT